jgi:hypothetical protein
MLENIKSTKDSYAGIRIAIAGVEKSGKTTLVCGSPQALLIPLESGYAGQDVQHIPMITRYQDFVSLLQEITTACEAGNFPFRTVVIDSVTALERLIHEGVLLSDPTYKGGANKNVTMNSAHGGYGKSFDIANERFMELLNIMDVLALHYGINMVFTAHVFADQMLDPQVGEYSSWNIQLHSPKNYKTFGKRELFLQWLDGIFFLHEPLMITEQHGIKKGISENRGRVLGLSRTPSYLAGNRFGLEGEISIPKEQGWNHLAQSIYESCGIDVYHR